MRRSRQIGRRLVRGATSALLAGSLLLLAPQAAMAQGRPAERPQSAAAASTDNGPPADAGTSDQPGEHANGNANSNRRPEPAAAERPEQAAGPADESSDADSTDAVAATPSSSGEDQQPTTNQAGATDNAQSSPAAPAPQAADTAHVAGSAPRTPGATAEAVTATTPAPRISDIEPSDPVALSPITAAGDIDAATRIQTAIGSSHRSSADGLPIDPLVPASLGLLLLARALRRPRPDERTHTL